MTNASDFWILKGEVAAVDVVDIRAVYTLMQDLKARNSEGRNVGISSTAYESICSPGADVHAVWYRTAMVGVLQMIPESPLAAWTHDGKLDDAVLQVVATFPMKSMEVGVVHHGPPFDLQEFLKQVSEAASPKNKNAV